MDKYKSGHELMLSPSQCPPNVPLLGYVEREITMARFPSTSCKALQSD